jgi:hypothetical protein
MKKLFALSLLTLLVISSLGVISASTLIAGIVYNSDYYTPVADANVTIDCVHNNITYTQYTTSRLDGTYDVTYTETGSPACNDDDIVTVSAVKGDLHGSKSGIVHENAFGLWDIAIVNVAIVPEFGVIVGILTLFGAISVFFVARRE